jgi:hypothetical protein
MRGYIKNKAKNETIISIGLISDECNKYALPNPTRANRISECTIDLKRWLTKEELSKENALLCANAKKSPYIIAIVKEKVIDTIQIFFRNWLIFNEKAF